MKKFKKIAAAMMAVSLGLFLTACSNSPITSHSTGLWDGLIVYNFSRAIIWLSKAFDYNYGIGIILFTIIIRIIILPLMVYQTKNMKEMAELQPQLKALQKKYSSRDTDTMMKLQAEQKALYKDNGVHPMASMLPMIVQLPVIFALYQAIWRTPELKTGHFLWLQLGSRDPYFILPILAALFTFFSSWLAMKSQPETNAMAMSMTFLMPVIIFFTALNVPSALSLYWVVTNAFQVVQTLVIQNPWKMTREREAKQRAKREHEKAVEKAIRRAKKSHKKR